MSVRVCYPCVFCPTLLVRNNKNIILMLSLPRLFKQHEATSLIILYSVVYEYVMAYFVSRIIVSRESLYCRYFVTGNNQ